MIQTLQRKVLEKEQSETAEKSALSSKPITFLAFARAAKLAVDFESLWDASRMCQKASGYSSIRVVMISAGGRRNCANL